MQKISRVDFFQDFDTILFDCDGVLWQGYVVIEGIIKVLEYLRGLNKRLLFVTNNSSKSRATLLKKLTTMGIDASVEEMFGSAYCAAYYLSKLNKRVFAIGMDGLYDELKELGVDFIPSSKYSKNVSDTSEMPHVELDNVDAVLFGLDIDLNYTKLGVAHRYLQDPECLFLATNSDTTFPAGGHTFPGTGALLSALTTSTSRTPKVLGKPHQTMLDCIVDKYHLDRSRTLMVGDRLDTDIEFGKLGGLKTLLVMSGVTTSVALQKSTVKPDFVIDSLGDFNKSL